MEKLIETLYRNLYDEADDYENYSGDMPQDYEQNQDFVNLGEQEDRQAHMTDDLRFDSIKSRQLESINDLNIGWDDFVDLKLILYSIEFAGKDRIHFTTLERRSNFLLFRLTL